MPHIFTSWPDLAGIDLDQFAFGISQVEDVALRQMHQALVEHIGEFEARRSDVGLIWDGILAKHEQVVAELKAKGFEAFRALVAHLFETPLTEGVAQGLQDAHDLRFQEVSRRHTATIILNRLFRLAEAVGAANVRNPEQSQLEITVRDLDDLFERIQKKIGFDLTPPIISGGLFGLQLAVGVFNERHFDAIYYAWRIKQLLEQRRGEMAPVCEIGGGAGFLAHYARRAGIRDYCIIDFPTLGILQYVVLGGELGSDRVRFGRSVENISLISVGRSPPDLDFSTFAMVVNTDSFPEMPAPIARGYVAAAARSGALLSINQESAAEHTIDDMIFRQSVVRDLCDGLLRPVYRFPSWLRMGYVEELFEPAKDLP